MARRHDRPAGALRGRVDARGRRGGGREHPVPGSYYYTLFMTGGTAFVPVVRGLFEARFGAAKLRSGDELLSITSGLALRAAAPDDDQ